jgi:polyketide synthase PksM
LRASVTDSLKILSGERSAIEVLFPSMSMRLVEPVYRNNVLADYYNKVTSVFLDKILGFKSNTPGEKITIIEIGAGTGGTSAGLFATLQPYKNKVLYVYTDISAGFVQYGKGHYAGALPDMRFCTLDIETDPSEQYRELVGSADIVISANAVHATSNIKRAVSNIRALMKPRGLVILNEVVDFQVYSTLTFGLLEGWWLYEDSEIRIPNSPLLSAKMWSDVFKSCGFGSIVSGNDCLKNQATSFQDIIVAQLE